MENSQSNTPPARDYGRSTGMQSGGLPLVKISSKEALFTHNNITSNSFAAFLDRVDMEFHSADPQHDLPDRWHINLVMSVADQEGGAYQVRVSLSSHWQNGILGHVINSIYGGLNSPDWRKDPNNRWMRIVLKKLEPKTPGGRATATAMVFKSLAFGDFLEGYYPWEDGKRKGAPEDLQEQTLFWLTIAKECVKLTGGAYTGFERATVKFPNMYDGTAGPSAPATGAPVPTGQPATGQPTEKPKSNADKFVAALTDRFDKILSSGSMDKSTGLVNLWNELTSNPNTDPEKFGLNKEWLKNAISKFAKSNDIADPFLIDTSPSQEDDLPF